MKYLSTRNMKKYQHYKKDKPNWIKLYKSLWGEYEFSVLPDATKAHVIGLFILCSQNSNLVVFDEKWISEELKAREPINFELILNSGFIVMTEKESIKSLDDSYLQKRREEQRREENISKKQKVFDGSDADIPEHPVPDKERGSKKPWPNSLPVNV